ncbi:MAG: hypothetical protein ABR955_00670 [Verrucomicrobiota bacterium]|jgi:hypothetical protein
MKNIRKTFQRREKGYALLFTLTFIGITLLLLVSVMNWSNSSAKQTLRNNLFNTSSGAAEAADETVIAYMERDFYDQALNTTTANYYSGDLPVTTGWPISYTFSNGSGVAGQTAVSTSPQLWTTNIVQLFNQYAGLYAASANCTVTSKATPNNQQYTVPATVTEQFQLVSIPIFQFAIFYNLNMEIDPGANMSVTGPVFSNGGLWAGTSNLNFNSSVAAVGSVYTNTTAAQTADPYIPNDTNYTGSGLVGFTGGAPASDQDALTMPIGTNSSPAAVQALLNLPPSAESTNPLSPYFYNQADIIISNSSSGTISAFFQNSNTISAIPYNAGLLTLSTNGITITTNLNQYSFATNVNFYDYREGKTVNAVQVNVGALGAWLTNSLVGIADNQANNAVQQHNINSVYVYNNVPMSNTNLPAVRLSNGSVLPAAGLTVVTPDPIYVLGNYNANGTSLNNTTNVANTVPAALIGDAITLLSADWNDATYTNGLPYTDRIPANTTVNAAAFEGIVESSGTNYSGGVENFLRLLEDWSGDTLTYNGSIVVMFPSQYATNRWQPTGNYYNAPTRKWAFDVNFKSQNGSPPLEPSVKAMIRGQWTDN